MPLLHGMLSLKTTICRDNGQGTALSKIVYNKTQRKQMTSTIKKSLQDIFSPMVLKFILKIGLGSILLWVTLLAYFWSSFSSFVTSFLSWIPFEWLQNSITYVAAPFVGYTLIIITIAILTSLYSEGRQKSTTPI